MTENGRFAFDLFNPWVHMLVREGVVFDGNYHDEEGNRINRRVEINKRDYFKQTQDIEEYYSVQYADGKPTSSNGFIPPVIFSKTRRRWCWRKTN